MERAMGLHTPQEAQHVLSDSQRLVPEGFIVRFDFPVTGHILQHLCPLFISDIYQSN